MKLLLALFISSIPLLGSGQIKYQLAGEAPANYNKKTIFLLIQDISTSNRYTIRDSAMIRENRFSFTGTIRKPCENATVSFKRPGDGTGSFSFVIDSGVNQMVINDTINNQPQFNQLANTTVLNSRSNLLVSKLHATQPVGFSFYKSNATSLTKHSIFS